MPSPPTSENDVKGADVSRGSRRHRRGLALAIAVGGALVVALPGTTSARIESGGGTGAAAGIAGRSRAELAAIGRLAELPARLRRTRSKPAREAAEGIVAQLALDPISGPVLAIWSLLHGMGRLADGAVDAGMVAPTSRAWLDELRLGPVIAGAFRALGYDEARAWEAVDLVRVFITLPRSSTVGGGPRRRLERLVAAWLADEDVRPFIRINRWEGIAWFNREAFEQLAAWMLVLDALEATADDTRSATEVGVALAESHRLQAALRAAGESSGYQIDRLVAETKPARSKVSPTGERGRTGGPRARGRRTVP